MTRSTASDGCCAAATTATRTPNGAGCCAGWTSATPSGEVAAAWIAAQELRLLYRLRDPQRAAQAFSRWLAFCADSAVPELHRLARTLDSWREELLARFHRSAVFNVPTEAVNLLIKKVKRVGHGFRPFTNYRLRLQGCTATSTGRLRPPPR